MTPDPPEGVGPEKGPTPSGFLSFGPRIIRVPALVTSVPLPGGSDPSSPPGSGSESYSGETPSGLRCVRVVLAAQTTLEHLKPDTEDGPLKQMGVPPLVKPLPPAVREAYTWPT